MNEYHVGKASEAEHEVGILRRRLSLETLSVFERYQLETQLHEQRRRLHGHYGEMFTIKNQPSNGSNGL